MPLDDDSIREHYEALDDQALAEAFSHGPQGYASPIAWETIVSECARRGMSPGRKPNRQPAVSERLAARLDEAGPSGVISDVATSAWGPIAILTAIFWVSWVLVGRGNGTSTTGDFAELFGGLVGFAGMSVVLVYLFRRISKARRDSGSPPDAV